MPALDQPYLDTLAQRLSAIGTRLAPGLSEAELAAAEGEFDVRFPDDLRQVLQAFLPLDPPERTQRPRWPNWRDGPVEVLRARLAWPWDGIAFDLEHTDVWLPAWGPRPVSSEERIDVARRLYEAAPRLVPIFAHRYISAEPPLAGNPVLSVYQMDIVYYGLDLVGYFQAEFKVPAPAWAATRARPIRYWDDLLGALEPDP